MMRLPTIFWLIVVATAGFAMFAVKYEVQALADQLAHSVKQADDTERDIRVLDAEWAYLNRPNALAQMNQRFLSLVPIATKQLRANIADLPMRPAPPVPPPPLAPPPPTPAETVAANGPAAGAAAAALQDPGPPPIASAQSAPPAQTQPTETATPVMTAALETPLAARPAKPAAIARAAVRPASQRRPASLNELIAQIAESR